MSRPVCISPLMFYDSVSQQERFKPYAYGHVSPLLCRSNFVPPFQFMSGGTLNRAVLVSINGSSDIDVTDKMRGECYSVGGAVFQYLGNKSLLPVKVEGEYYLDLTLTGDSGMERYYSEVMCFSTGLSDCLEIEYSNPETDFYLKGGRVSFDNGFCFRLLVRSQLGKPEYTYEEEATNRYGYTFIESQVSKKVYKFNAVLPEYMCDAMRLIRLCSKKSIRTNTDELSALTFGMSVEWQEQGDLASVDCEFDVDNVITCFGGPAKEPSGYDYNIDYNNDYNAPNE